MHTHTHTHSSVVLCLLAGLLVGGLITNGFALMPPKNVLIQEAVPVE